MDRGLLAPLSPNEEIALRRVAHGCVDVAVRHAERLVKLALVEPSDAGLRLTALGLSRVRAIEGPAPRATEKPAWLSQERSAIRDDDPTPAPAASPPAVRSLRVRRARRPSSRAPH